jgi:tetratricopeptide (TPR) repeat protein
VSAAPVLVVLVAVACYLDSLGGALLFDDLNAIVRNRAVRWFDLEAIFGSPSWIAGAGDQSLYRPVTTFTFAVDHAVHGLAPLGYHLVNVGLHAAVCVLLWHLLRRASGHPRVSLGAAVLFAAHPVHTEAVASVVGRAELLAALGALGAWALVLRSRRPGSRRGPWLAAAAAAVFAGVLSKENAATAVGIVAAADLVYRGRREGVGPVARRAAPDWLALLAGALAALALRVAIMGRLGLTPPRLDNVVAGAPWAPRLMTVVGVVARAAGVLLWPFDLSADYSYAQIPLVTSPADPVFLAGLLVLAISGAAAVAGWRRSPDACFGVAFAALTYAVVSNAVVTTGTIMAERLLYLPSAGFCLLVAVGIETAARRLGRAAGPRAATAVTAALVLVWGAGTVARNRVWSDPLVFAEALVADAPRSARSHRELALAYRERGRHTEAEAQIRQALAILPDSAVSLYDLGHVLMRAGRFDDAIAAYRRALEVQPDMVDAMINLANAYSARGDEAAAEEWFRRAIALRPDSADAHMNLANTLLRLGRMQEAEAEYRRALALEPRAVLARMNSGALLDAAGRHREAAAQYRAVIAAAPSPAAYQRLVASLAAAGLDAEARAAQADAVRRFGGAR